MRTTALVFMAALVATAMPAMTGKADVIFWDEAVCQGRPLGTECMDGGFRGECQGFTCARLDYANWNRDASSTPPTQSYPCNKCAPEGSSDAGGVDAGGGDAGGDDDGDDEDEEEGCGGCSSKASGGGSFSDYLGAAALIAGLHLFVRRRRPKR